MDDAKGKKMDVQYSVYSTVYTVVTDVASEGDHRRKMSSSRL